VINNMQYKILALSDTQSPVTHHKRPCSSQSHSLLSHHRRIGGLIVLGRSLNPGREVLLGNFHRSVDLVALAQGFVTKSRLDLVVLLD
jgi:hypothetical protein